MSAASTMMHGPMEFKVSVVLGFVCHLILGFNFANLRIIFEYSEDSVMKLEKSSAMFPTAVSLFPENGIHHSCDIGCIQLAIGIHIAHLRHVDGHRGGIGVVIALLHSINANREGAANC